MNEAAIAKQKDIPLREDAKMLHYDLEISPLLSYAYEAYDANALKILIPAQIVSFAWSWEGEDKIYCMCVADYPDYKPGIFKLDDTRLVRDLYDIVQEADILVGHNIRQFDIPMMRTRFLLRGLPPTKPWATIDTLKDTKRQFRFPKNNLGYVSEATGGEGKTDKTHSDVIWGCLDGDTKKWRDMKTYNKNDVKIEKEYYTATKGWYTNHVNLSFFSRENGTCPTCGSRKIQSRGKNTPTRTGVKKRYVCMDCGHWFTGEILKDGFDKIKSYG